MTLPNWYITLREPIKLSKTFFPTKYKQSLYFANEITWNAIYQKIHWTLKVVWLNQKNAYFSIGERKKAETTTSIRNRIPPIKPLTIAPAFDFIYSLGSEKTKKWLLDKKLPQISYIIKGLRDHQTSSNNYLLYYVNPRSQYYLN